MNGSLLPLDDEPDGPFLPEAARLALLVDALRGVDLGAHDERIVAWLARCDSPTVRTVVSLLGRVRAVAPVGLEVTCGQCGTGLTIDHEVFHVVTDDGARRAARLRDEPEGGR